MILLVIISKRYVRKNEKGELDRTKIGTRK